MTSKKLLLKLNCLFFCAIASQSHVSAQCGTPTLVGTVDNLFSHVLNSQKTVAVDKTLNTIALIHRNSAALNGGNNGQLRYAISTDAGATWTTELGPLNPVASSGARYPNILIHNPAANTNTAQAKIGYFATTNNGGTWNGVVTGVASMGSASASENYNLPQPPIYHLRGQAVNGAPGEFWVAGQQYSTAYHDDINVYKGNLTSQGDINWVTNTVITVPTVSNQGYVTIAECEIAFDPAGTVGWMAVLADPLNGPGGSRHYPIFYKTTDGGQTWSAPKIFDYSQYSCATASLTGSTTPAIDREMALIVDVNGNPHLMISVGAQDGPYAIDYDTWHGLYDITIEKGIWNMQLVSPVKAGPASLNNVPYKSAPQLSRTADGKKIFYAWCDNSTYTMGEANFNPDLFGRAFDLQLNLWTPIKNFTSCNPQTDGKIFFNHLAMEVLEPTVNQFKLAPVYAKLSPNLDPLSPGELIFLDGCTFSISDFTIAHPVAPLTILPSPPLGICPADSLFLSTSFVHEEYLWSNGSKATNLRAPIGNMTLTTRNGCTVSSATIAVPELTIHSTSSATTICEGQSHTLTVNGNAGTYSWTPGNLTGTTVVVNPTSPTTYVVMASGNGCAVSANILVHTDACLSIHETQSTQRFGVYPNPSTGKIYLTSIEDQTLLVYDGTGKLVLKAILNDSNKNFLSVDLPKGIYLVTSERNPEVFSKIVVN